MRLTEEVIASIIHQEWVRVVEDHESVEQIFKRAAREILRREAVIPGPVTELREQ